MNVTNTLLRTSSGEGSPRPLYPAQKLRPQRLAAEAGCWEWVLPGKVPHGASSPFSPSSTHDAQAGFAFSPSFVLRLKHAFLNTSALWAEEGPLMLTRPTGRSD